MISGRKEWTKFIEEPPSGEESYKEVAHCIWMISFFAWTPFFTLLIMAAKYQAFNLHLSDHDDRRDCKGTGILNNWLVLIPLFAYPSRVALDAVLLLLRPELNFRQSIKWGLASVYFFAVMMLCLRSVISYLVERSTTLQNEAFWINFQLYLGVGFICFISLSQCFVNFKLH